VDIHSNMRWHDAEEASFMNYDLGTRVEKVDCSRISNCQFCDSKLTSCSPPGAVAQCSLIDQDNYEVKGEDGRRSRVMGYTS
jgi:hypothetical protein